MKEKRNKIIVITSIVAILLLLTLGITYAAYNYNRTGTNSELVLGDIYMHYNETNQLTIENAMPSNTYDETKYFEFTIDGKNTYLNKDIWYEIVLNHGEDHATRTERIKDNLLKFTLVEIINDEETVVANAKSYEEINNTRIWVNTIEKNTTKEVNKTYRLYMWISDSTLIGNTENADYDIDTWNNEVFASIKVSVSGDFEEKGVPITVENSEDLKNLTISKNTDTCKTYVEEDGITYLSGDNTCIDFNYVWYSGKLWRITAIYPDGTMKMITQDNITIIAYGEDYNFYTDEETTSWIYQWLNEDFLDTLYNYENIIVTDSLWNVTSGDGTISTKLDETTMVSAKVGLLNSYEYYLSYKNLGTYENGFLNIGYYWWLSNRLNTSSSYVWRVHYKGNGDIGTPSSDTSGARPSVNLKSDIKLSGSGTKADPYRITGDKEEIVANTTLLNTRTSGEYVNFDGELYRIVGIENNTTKLNKVDYVRDESNEVMLKYFSSRITYGSGTSDDYWDYYLNNTWYNNISSDYKSMLEKGTYYLGTVSSSAQNYKLAICATASNTVTTKECTKTSSIYEGYVGLPRYGEMFSSLGTWLITPIDSTYVWYVNLYGYLYYLRFSPGSSGPSGIDGIETRPSINLSSSVVITSGFGLENNPFEIKLS